MNIKLLERYYDSDEYLTKLRARISVLKEFEEDEYARAAKILDIYAVDPIRFIEDFCFIKADKLDGSPKPFFLFEYQKKIIYKLQELENGGEEAEFLADKPREMGITWLMCCYFLWRWLFTPNYSAFILSRTEAEVDDGTRNPQGSIFSKIRWQIDLLPKYMLPESYQRKEGRGTTTDMNLKLINPNLGTSLTGSSTNASAGRSRRYSTCYIDECFFIEHFSEVYRSLQSVSKVKIFTSTVVHGRVYEDFKKTLEAKGNYMSLRWSDHPFKDKEWYDQMVTKAEQMNDPDIMREVEPSYALSEKAMYYPQVRLSRVEPFEYRVGLPVYVSMDIGGKHDLTVAIFWQFDGGWFYCLDAYFNKNRPLDWYAPFLNKELLWNPSVYNEAQARFIMKVRDWKKPTAYFGELDHFAARHPTNVSSAQVLAKLGIRLMYNQYAVKFPPRYHATTQLLPRTIFNSNSDGAMRVYDGIASSRYSGSVRTTTEQLKPIHDDEIADFRAAAENFYVNVPRILRVQREDVHRGDLGRDVMRGIMKSLKI